MNCRKGRAELQYGLQISSKIPQVLQWTIQFLWLFGCSYLFRVCFPRLPVISILPVPLFNRGGLGNEASLYLHLCHTVMIMGNSPQVEAAKQCMMFIVTNLVHNYCQWKCCLAIIICWPQSCTNGFWTQLLWGEWVTQCKASLYNR